MFVDSIPACSQFRPIIQCRRRPGAGARLPRLGLAGSERFVVPRPAGADAIHRLASDAVDGTWTTSRLTVDHRRRRTVGPRLLHVCGLVRRVGRRFTPAQRYRPRQSQRSYNFSLIPLLCAMRLRFVDNVSHYTQITEFHSPQALLSYTFYGHSFVTELMQA